MRASGLVVRLEKRGDEVELKHEARGSLRRGRKDGVHEQMNISVIGA